MPFYDITGSTKIKSASSKDELTGELVRSFRAKKFKTRSRKDFSENQIGIETSFWQAIGRYAYLRRISDGRIKIKQQEPGHYLLEYHLSIFPIRVLYAIIGLLPLILFPIFFSFQGMPFRFENSFSYFPLFYPAVSLLAYFVQRFWTKLLFKRFIKKTLKEETEDIKHTSLKTNQDTKVILATFFLGILFLLFLVAGFFGVKIMLTRSKMLWHTPLENIVMSAPAIDKNVVYFGSLQEEEKSTFYALNAENGREIWSATVDGSVQNSPTLAEGLVLFSTGEGSFYALNIKNGQEIWRFAPEKRNLNPDTCESCALKFNQPTLLFYWKFHPTNFIFRASGV